MAIEFIKDNPTTIRCVYQGKWTWAEFYENQKEIMAFLDQTTHPTDIIIDLRESDGLPSGALGHLKNMKYVSHPQLSTTILLGATMFLQAMATMLQKVRPDIGESIFLDTLEEAHTYLSEIRSRGENTTNSQ